MDDIIERAEAWRDHGLGSDPVPELIAELKAARARLAGRLEPNLSGYLAAEGATNWPGGAADA